MLTETTVLANIRVLLVIQLLDPAIIDKRQIIEDIYWIDQIKTPVIASLNVGTNA